MIPIVRLSESGFGEVENMQALLTNTPSSLQDFEPIVRRLSESLTSSRQQEILSVRLFDITQRWSKSTNTPLAAISVQGHKPRSLDDLLPVLESLPITPSQESELVADLHGASRRFFDAFVRGDVDALRAFNLSH